MKLAWRVMKQNWIWVLNIVFYSAMSFIVTKPIFSFFCGITVGVSIGGLIMQYAAAKYPLTPSFPPSAADAAQFASEMHHRMLASLGNTVDLVQRAITDLEWSHEQAHQGCDPKTCPILTGTLHDLKVLDETLRSVSVSVDVGDPNSAAE